VSHASRASGRKSRRQQRRLVSLAATLPNPPQPQWHGPVKEALGQDRSEDKPAAARLERRGRISIVFEEGCATCAAMIAASMAGTRFKVHCATVRSSPWR
jgi:hypothetical protein